MFVCPICNKQFATVEEIKKHSLPCWKKANPHHKSKTAPKGETIITKEVDSNILDFFSSLKKGENNDSKS